MTMNTASRTQQPQPSPPLTTTPQAHKPMQFPPPKIKCEDPQLVDARSGRSKCQVCGDFIAFGSKRVGLPARHNGITVTKWLHPVCFARHGLRCDYAPTDRAHCSGDGSLIGKGEPRIVMFLESPCGDRVVHQKTYKPQNAASFLGGIFALPNVTVRPDTIEGLESLETAAHRTWVESAVRGLAAGPAPTRTAAERTTCEDVLGEEASSKSATVRAVADPLFLDGCTIRVKWPQSCRAQARLCRGTIYYMPLQPRRKAANEYLLLLERCERRSSERPRAHKTSWQKLRKRWYEVVASPRVVSHCWSEAELAAAQKRLENGESFGSVGLALGHSAQAVKTKLSKGMCTAQGSSV